MKPFYIFLITFLFFPTPAMPDVSSDRGLIANLKKEKIRHALVIGNSAYKTSPLKNPVNDARDFAEALKKLGFDVILKENADQRTMEKAIGKFGRQLRGGGAGLFYFAGHGMQVNGRNYLIPVDVEIESESDVKYESVDAGRVLGKMEDAGNELNIVILDACRNNPFARSFRSSVSGLARMDAPQGTLIAYATAPESVAADGSGRNGTFTKHLLTQMHTPGLTVEQVLKRVRVGVIRETKKRQIPWVSTSMTGDFYFAGRGGVPVERIKPSAEKIEPVYATLTIRANAPDTRVYLDGEKIGVAPIKISKVGAGYHRLDARADGYKKQTRELILNYGDSQEIRFTLAKLSPPPQSEQVVIKKQEPVQSTTGGHSRTLSRISERGELRVAIDPGYVPFAMKDKKGKLIGFDIDIAEAMAKELGVKLVTVETAWDAIITKLMKGKSFDIIINGMTITKTRQQKIDFSDPYVLLGATVILNSRNKETVKSYRDLNNSKYSVASKTGSYLEHIIKLKVPNARYIPLATEGDAFKAVLTGKVDAFVYDRAWCLLAMAREETNNNLILLDEQLSQEKVGMAIKKGDPDFLNWVNGFLYKIKKDGRYDTAFNKWFKSYKWSRQL